MASKIAIGLSFQRWFVLVICRDFLPVLGGQVMVSVTPQYGGFEALAGAGVAGIGYGANV